MCFLGMAGLPIGLPDFLRQNSRNFRFLHRIPVSGLTRINSERQSCQTLETRHRKSRSRSFNRGFLALRLQTASCCLRTSIRRTATRWNRANASQTEGLGGQNHEQYVHVGSVKVARRKCQVESGWIEFLRTTGGAAADNL